MTHIARLFAAIILSITGSLQTMSDDMPFEVDSRSAHMGALGMLGEMVRLDVKKLGLGYPVSPGEMDIILPVAAEIAERNGVQFYRERDFLTTDLYPEGVTEGKEVVLMFKGDTLNEYMALKEEKAQLMVTGQYDKAARIRIASAFGRLLSYPGQTIALLLGDNPPAPH